MIETLTHIQWLVISLAALSIGMSKTGVQGIMLMIVPLMAMAFGALIGIRIVKLLPERVFRRFIQIVTVISVILMVI